ncbi:hypothetical protein, partial [Streptomyces scabiei]|uniref:hypothetical protein n=1 Tax=Streptomyces scabiei TaxID=1930 RepID=UPI0038F5E66D
LPTYNSSEFEYFSHREDKLEELIDDINRRNVEHEVVKEISKISSPIFLGLDRRRDFSGNNKQDYFHEREMWMHKKNAKFGGV